MLRALFLGTTLLVATGALAEDLKVEDPTTRENEVRLDSDNTIHFGSVPNGDTRSSHSLGAYWGIVPGVRTGFDVEIENERGAASPSVNRFTWSNTFGILGAETIADILEPHPGENVVRERNPDGFALSAFVSTNFGVNDNSEGNITTGPLFGYRSGPLSFAGNTLINFPLSGDGNPSFVYAASALYDVTGNIAMGIEAHGEVADIFGSDTSGTSRHLLGPVARARVEVEPGREVGLRLGGFFGLTDDTPDFTGSVNLELAFD